MVGLFAFDDVLRLIFRGLPLVAFEDDLRRHFLLNRTSHSARFRIPLNVVASFKVDCHRLALAKTAPLLLGAN